MTFTEQAAELAAYQGRHRVSWDWPDGFDRDVPQRHAGRHRDDTLGAQLLDDAIRMGADRLEGVLAW